MTTIDLESPYASPGTAGYAASTAAYNLNSVPKPAQAVTVTTISEAREALAFARARGIGIRVFSTGHSAESAAPFNDELLIRTRIDGEIEVDQDARTARVPAGANWGDVAAAVNPLGLTALHGSSFDVGVIGYLGGGGASLYGRQYGVSSNSVLEMTLLTADGDLRTISHNSDPELFWALRGGGNGFGIITSVVIPLIPMTSVVTGIEFWDMEHAPALLAAWEAWTRTAPRAASTAFRMMNIPPVPGFPESISGHPVLAVDGAIIDTANVSAEKIASDLLDPLRAIAEPLFSTWHRGGPADVLLTHLDPPEPLPYILDSFLLNDLGEEGQQALLDGVNAGPSLMVMELRHLEGAFSDRNAAGGAVDHYDGKYIYMSFGAVDATHRAEASMAELDRIRRQIAPWASGYTMPNFIGGYTRPQRSFDERTAARVDAIRRRLDPDGVFTSNIVRGAAGLPIQ